MKPKYFLPMTLDGLIAWMQRGAFRSATTTPIVCWDLTDDQTQQAIVAALPEFEDDYQVLVAEIEPLPPVLSLYRDIPLEKLISVTPMSSRALEMLDGRIPGAIPIGAALFETAFHREKKRRLRDAAIRGAKALMSLGKVQGQVQPSEALDDALAEAASECAIRERPEPGRTPDFVEVLFRYRRQSEAQLRFPDSAVGSLLDYLSLTRTLAEERAGASGDSPSPWDVIESKLVDAHFLRVDDEEGMVDGGKTWKDLDALAVELDAVHTATACAIGDMDRTVVSLGPQACAMFFAIRQRLNERPNSMGYARISSLIDEFRAVDSEATASALWLAGALFRFTHFADEYFALCRDQRTASTVAERSVDCAGPEAPSDRPLVEDEAASRQREEAQIPSPLTTDDTSACPTTIPSEADAP